MAANPNLGNDASTDAGTQPENPVQPDAQKPIEGDVTKLLAGLSDKVDLFGKELRGLQGRQQKSDNKFAEFQAQLAKLDQYKKMGMSDAEAFAEMQSDDAAEQRWTNLERKLEELAERIAGGGTQANGQQSVAKVFETVLGAEALKNPLVSVELGKQYGSQAEMEAAAYRMFYQLSQSPSPTAAQGASLQGGGASATSQDALLAQMNEALSSGDFARSKELEIKLREAGVPGW